MTNRERFLAATRCEPVDRTPLWIMRQAGRYLPEYRKLKEKHDFLTLVRTPELAAEVTLQPLQRFDFDAAIIFSDILVIPEALGQPYRFSEREGITMDYTLASPPQIDKLDPTAIREKLAYVVDALQLVRRELGRGRALLGFGGSPWTLATYMVEGVGLSKNFEKIKTLYYSERAQFEKLLEKITAALIDYFRMQIEAGVDAIQLFDSWGCASSGLHYQEVSLKWIQRIIAALDPHFPVILFAKGMASHAEDLTETGASILSLDSTVQLGKLRQQLPQTVALQGNLDPVVLNLEPDTVRAETRKILTDMASSSGHIFNLGHGILPQAKITNVEILVETVHSFSHSERRSL